MVIFLSNRIIRIFVRSYRYVGYDARFVLDVLEDIIRLGLLA